MKTGTTAKPIARTTNTAATTFILPSSLPVARSTLPTRTPLTVTDAEQRPALCGAALPRQTLPRRAYQATACFSFISPMAMVTGRCDWMALPVFRYST